MNKKKYTEEEIKQHKLKREKDRHINLTDVYLRTQIKARYGLSREEITPSVIQCARERILKYREEKAKRDAHMETVPNRNRKTEMARLRGIKIRANKKTK